MVVAVSVVTVSCQGGKFFVPKGPFRAKNSTESKFTTARKIRYGSSKTIRRVLRSACPSRKRGRKTVQIVKNYGSSKRLRIRAPYSF